MRTARKTLSVHLHTFAALFLAAAIPSAYAAEQNQLDGSPSIFSVMAALNATGMDYGLASSHPLRAAIREELAKRNIPVLAELKRFVRDHRKADPAADLSQYISFALSVHGPPDFRTRFLNNEIPPDVEALEGFEALMIRFHREAGIDELWQKSQAALDRELERSQEPVSRAVLEVHGYLRNPTSGYMGRRFQVYLDLLGPGNQIHTRSYKDDYFLVLTPGHQTPYTDVRHAYLHYLLDPLATKFAEAVNKKRGLGDLAQGSPILEESYKNDFLLLATESLIKAVEARLATPEKRGAMVQEALSQGFILTPYFAEALPLYEKQEQAMRFYYPEMIAGIDLKKESRRLDNVQFASRRTERMVPSREPPQPVLSQTQKALEAADGYYSGRELEKARSAYLRVLQSSETAMHARAYYGLGRIAALERDPGKAQELFRKTLESSPDPQTRAWTEIYLGRLAMVENPPAADRAAEHFRRALAIEGASNAVKQAAENDLKKLAGSRP
jgi:tetratricopeptide (TPR) repeat protein